MLVLELPFKCVKNPKEILCNYTQPPKSIAGKPCQCAREIPSSFVLIRVVEVCKNTSLWLHVTNQ